MSYICCLPRQHGTSSSLSGIRLYEARRNPIGEGVYSNLPDVYRAASALQARPRVQGRRSSKYRHEDLAKHTRRHIHTATLSTTFPGTHEVVLENAWGLVVDRIYWQIDDLDIDLLFALGS